MTQDPRAVALAQEICSGLGVGNLSDRGMAILVRHIEDALTDARRQGMGDAKLIADTVAAKHPAPDDWMARLAAVSISNLIEAKAQASQEAPTD